MGSERLTEVATPVDVPGYYDHDQTELLKLVSVPVASVLEVGCASGGILRHFADRGVGRLTGVEYVESVAERARRGCPTANVITGDVDAIPDAELGGGYDLIVASFVLEHVTDPWRTLGRLAKLLRPGGQVVGSLPNVRHLSVTIPLLFAGRWEYVDDGIMDRTHYRFFTRSTIEDLLRSSGVGQIVIRPWIGSGKYDLGNRLTLGVLSDLFAFAYRFSAIRSERT